MKQFDIDLEALMREKMNSPYCPIYVADQYVTVPGPLVIIG